MNKKTTPYCKNCQYYIEYSPEIISMSRNPNEDGHDVCGFSIGIQKNHIGNDSIITQGGINYCEECGAPLKDERTPIYKKCIAKNKHNQCKDFLKITLLQTLKNKLKSVIIKVNNMLKTFNIEKSYLLLFWLIFNAIFLVHNDFLSIIGIKQTIYYSLITLAILGTSMRK